MQLDKLQTPTLLLDALKMNRNVARLLSRLDGVEVRLRIHVKTLKSPEALFSLPPEAIKAITVSTLKEAEVFASHGITDILYAVCVAPDKLPRVANIRMSGCDLICVVDSLAAAQAISIFARDADERFAVLVEIDADGHRSGVDPQSPQLIAIAKSLVEGGCELKGVMAHAGSSYACLSRPELVAIADQECSRTLAAAQTLRDAGLPCPIVSVGSTPTAHFATGFKGITEARAGVFTAFDLVMAGLGVCDIQDIALSVLATVIGHQTAKGWIIIDAGWMALSRDRGTAKQAVDYGYGVVCDLQGRPYPDLIVVDVNQEHGILAMRPGSRVALPDLPYGAKVRILPNHACATAAQHDRYSVVNAENEIVDSWKRFGGW